LKESYVLYDFIKYLYYIYIILNIYFFKAKAQSPKLLPFLATLVLYFSLVRKDPRGELWTTVLKCLPIVALMFYVVAKGISLKKE